MQSTLIQVTVGRALPRLVRQVARFPWLHAPNRVRFQPESEAEIGLIGRQDDVWSGWMVLTQA